MLGTDRLNGETEDVLHVCWQLRIVYADTPAVPNTIQQDGPHWQAAQHLLPRHTLWVMVMSVLPCAVTAAD